MGLTIDDNIIDLGYSGGHSFNWKWLFGAVVSVAVLIVIVLAVIRDNARDLPFWSEGTVAHAAGRASGQRTSLATLTSTNGA